ncbi:MAG: DUF5723 family protein [Cytophagaceae bacterium]
MKKLLLSILGVLPLVSSYAQIDGSVFTAMGRSGVGTTMTTDYQCIGINPANLGIKTKYETKHVTIGFLEGGIGAFAQGITRSQLDKYVIEPIANNNSLTPEESMKAADLMKNNAISANIDLMLFGLAIQNEKLGGLGFRVTEHISVYGAYSGGFSSFGYSGALSTQYFDQLRLQDNSVVPNDPSQYDSYQTIGIKSGISSTPISFGQIVDGSKTQHNYYRSIDAAYGRKVWGDELLEIHAGVTLKYLMGYNYMDVTASNGSINGLVAISPTFANSDSTVLNIPTKENKGNVFTPAGQGVGADIGITGVFKETIKFGVSIVNIGSINYNNNTVRIRDTAFTEVEYHKEALKNFNELLYWDPISSFKVKLPTMLRFGGSIALMENKLEIGADIIIPLNKVAGNLQHAYYAIGGDFYVTRWFKVSSGMNMGGNFANNLERYKTTFNVPLGFTFIVGENGGWEVGLATRDVQSLLFAQSKGVNTSLGFGFFRFRF